MIRQIRNTLLVALLALPLFLSAQEEARELSDKDQRKFDFYFYEASRYKQIERYEKALANYLECFKIDDSNATVAFEIGRLYLQMSNAQEGLEYLETAYSLEEDNKWVALELADLYNRIGAFAEATLIFEKLTNEDQANVPYRFELAQLYYAQKRYQDCLKTLNNLEVLIGVNEDLSQQKKEIYLLLDDEEGARKEMEKLVEAYPANLEYKGLLAQYYAANLMFDEAIAVYEGMLIEAPDDPRAHLDLANIYKQQKKYDQSVEHLKIALASTSLEVDRKIQVIYSIYQLSERDTSMIKMGYELLEISINATPKEPKLYAMLADFQLRDNNLKGARDNFRKSTRLGANQLQIWSEILILDARLDLIDSMAIDGEAFIELYPNQPLGYLMAGTGNLELENFQESVNYFEAGLDFIIDNVELEEQFYISLADAYHRMEEHVKSDSYFDKALELLPNSPTILNNYAYYLSERGVRLDYALEMTEKSNRLAPNNAVFLDTWAWVLYKKGSYKEALEKMEACAQLGGAESGEVLEHWGDILFKLGQTEEAVLKWKEAAAKGDASANIQSKIDNQKLYE